MSGSDNPSKPPPEPLAATLLQDAPCGFLVIDRRERIRYANSTLERWLNREQGSLADATGLKELLTHASHFYYQTQIAPMIQLQGFAREISCKLRIAGSDRSLPVLMNAVQRGEGDARRVDIVFFDATERLRFEHDLRMARAEAEELAAIVRSATVGILRCSAEGRITRHNAAAAELLGIASNAPPDLAVDRVLRLDTETPDWFAKAVRDIDASGATVRFEASCDDLHYNISVDRIPRHEDPLAAPDYSLILRDITARVRAERRLNLLVSELNHRIRNVFSVVSGLVRQTIRSAPEERTKLIDRLQSFSASHDVLTLNYWKDASILEVIGRVEAQIGDSQTLITDGPDIRLIPRQFKALSMALHELTTNARKYGALSSDFGVIEIEWQREAEDGFTFCWRERGGPPVREPARTGFGSVMIERVLAEEFLGTAEVSYAPTGLSLICRGRIMQD
ncbi:HWE histidine kinase domain-containing protein [Marinovum sp.]|uniref:HWE histidine kinase domain-containing protein n=1 Tax=Marinovum sp. TaxID=2024839 RepID=UPI002B266A3D|nr:HWE histidine kinase domain-containing protein [Marinovum sp.]